MINTDAIDVSGEERKSYIADYNFDSYDDFELSIPNAGMGVCLTLDYLVL